MEIAAWSRSLRWAVYVATQPDGAPDVLYSAHTDHTDAYLAMLRQKHSREFPWRRKADGKVLLADRDSGELKTL